MLKLFILDDARSIAAAVRDAGLSLKDIPVQVSLCRPFRWSDDKVVQDFQDATELVKTSKFDLWILDNDLGNGLEGIDFLKLAISEFPEFLPKSLRSCSGNRPRREDIEALFTNFQKAQAK